MSLGGCLGVARVRVGRASVAGGGGMGTATSVTNRVGSGGMGIATSVTIGATSKRGVGRVGMGGMGITTSVAGGGGGGGVAGWSCSCSNLHAAIAAALAHGGGLGVTGLGIAILSTAAVSEQAGNTPEDLLNAISASSVKRLYLHRISAKVILQTKY